MPFTKIIWERGCVLRDAEQTSWAEGPRLYQLLLSRATKKILGSECKDNTFAQDPEKTLSRKQKTTLGPKWPQRRKEHPYLLLKIKWAHKEKAGIHLPYTHPFAQATSQTPPFTTKTFTIHHQAFSAIVEMKESMFASR